MEQYHNILVRQIRKFLAGKSCEHDHNDFLESVSDTYTHADEDHDLIERSLDISSKELTSINEQLRGEIKRTKEQADELRRLNKVMIGRELRIIELKQEVNSLLNSNKYKVE